MFSHNFEIIFFVTFIILLTLVLGILGIIQWIKKFWTAARLFLEMMLFLLLCGGWVLTDSLVPMVFTNNSILVCVSSFYMFMLMPIPMVLFVQDLCGRKSRIGRELVMGFLILAAVCSVSYVAGGPDFLVLMPVVHLLLAVTVIWLLMYLLREYRATRSYYAGGMLLAIAALGIFGVVGIIEYYSGSANSWDASRMFCCGFIAFVVVLAVLVAKQSLEKVRIETESRAYQKMAYIDALTQMGNRLSFEEQCAQLNGEKLRKITAAILDVNGMKQVNDIYGHSAGDEMMQTVAAAIREVFGRKGGECFRIGGDEFAVILYGEFDEDTMSELLHQKINELVKDVSYDITVAIGFARAADYPELAVKEIFKVADTRMYKNKEQWYIANGK